MGCKEGNVSSAEYSPEPGLYDAPHLARNSANFAALSPLALLSRTAAVYPDKPAVIHGATRLTYLQFYQRCRQFADALRRRGITEGDTVAVMAPNVPALLEAHYGVPMAGAVLQLPEQNWNNRPSHADNFLKSWVGD